MVFALYAFVVAASIIYSNPTLFTPDLLLNRVKNPSLIWEPVLLHPTKVEEGGNIFYRESPERSAVFQFQKLPRDFKSEWSTENINVGIHAASKSSAISDDKNIFVGSDSSWFYSFSKTGVLRWKIYLAETMYGIHSTPAIDENSVYVGSYRGTLYRINKDTGEIIWSRIVGQTIGSSPLLSEDSITVAVETYQKNGYVVRLNKENGDLIWKSANLGEQSHSSPSLDVKLGVLVVGVNNSTVQGLDYKTGKILWSTPVKGPVKSTINIQNGRGFGTSWGKELFSIDIQSGRLNWSAELNEKSQVSPAFSQSCNCLITSDRTGEIFAINADSGERIWTLPTVLKGQLSSPVLLKNNQQEKILFYCREKVLCLIDPRGKIEKTWPTRGTFTGSPFLDKDHLYLSYNEGPLESFKIIF
jgi:outer membrane protein assembly factor BamB